MKIGLSNKNSAFALIALLAILSPFPLFAQAGKSNTSADTRDVIHGAFTVKVPSDWRNFSASESDQLRSQYLSQILEMYRQLSGRASIPVNLVDFAAFHIEGDAGMFAIISSTHQPHSDLINLLKR